VRICLTRRIIISVERLPCSFVSIKAPGMAPGAFVDKITARDLSARSEGMSIRPRAGPGIITRSSDLRDGIQLRSTSGDDHVQQDQDCSFRCDRYRHRILRLRQQQCITIQQSRQHTERAFLLCGYVRRSTGRATSGPAAAPAVAQAQLTHGSAPSALQSCSASSYARAAPSLEGAAFYVTCLDA
jgi:hypothetical protein